MDTRQSVRKFLQAWDGASSDLQARMEFRIPEPHGASARDGWRENLQAWMECGQGTGGQWTQVGWSAREG